LSYDVQVFSQRTVSADELRQLLAEAGLAVDEAGVAAGSLPVVRGARARYSFTLGLPVAVEAEDVPEEVTAVLLGPSYLYELMVEGSSTTETPHAVRFARRLAQASAGVVLDQQTGEVWARGKPRAAPPVQRGTIDIVDVHWYVRPGGTGARAAEAWLDLARRHLPEALPRRFGSYEPLAMKLDLDGRDVFVQAVAGEDYAISFKATAPCIEGGLAGGSGRTGVNSHRLSVHRGALADPRWRAALQRLFVEFAAATDAVFASAEVQRGVEWSGRSAWFGATAERTTYLAARGRWAGLLPYPVWWSWFGPDYVSLVIDHLPAGQVEHVNGGVFHPRGDEPLDRDQLTAALGDSSGAPERRRTLRGLFSPAEPRTPAPTWLPRELLPIVDDSDPRSYNPPLTPAETIPAGLRAER
jgi:hypothetical protein